MRTLVAGAGTVLALSAALGPAAATVARLHPDTAHTQEDVGTRGNVLRNDYPSDGTLRVESFHLEHSTTVWTSGTTAHPHGGHLAVSPNGDWYWSPKTDWNGHFQVVYTTNTGGSTTLDITTEPVPDAPQARDDVLDRPADTPSSIGLLELTRNDVDADGDRVVVHSVWGCVHCRLVWGGGSISFHPEHGFRGVAELRYDVEDPSGRTSTSAVVSINLS